jgi:hypothetical protein
MVSSNKQQPYERSLLLRANMDCRVKPGNDAAERRRAARAPESAPADYSVARGGGGSSESSKTWIEK